MADSVARLIAGTDQVWYWPDFLTQVEEAELLGVASAIPERGADEHDPRVQLAFTRLVIDGSPVEGRREAAAGDPIWFAGEATTGQPLPPPIQTLADRAGHWVERVLDTGHSLRGATPLTSVYIDRYGPGGTFVAHTDRDCYGPAVVGISIGPGSCLLRFTDDACCGTIDLPLAPRSLYAFLGPMRSAPWTHEVLGTTDLRYGITLRSRSSPADGETPIS